MNASTADQRSQLVAIGELIRSAQSGFASGERSAAGVMQLRMNNVTTDGILDWSSYIRVPATDKQIQAYSLQPGDVLFNSTNSPELVGKTVVFHGFKEPAVFSNHFLRLRVDEERLDSRYLAHWIMVQWQKRVFEQLATQWVNQASVRKEDLLSLSIPLPPLPEQQRIARILSRADRLRRLRRYALEMGEGYLQSVFLEMFGDPATNPKEWEVHRLGRHIKFLTSGPRAWADYYSTAGVRFIRSLDVQMNRISDENPIYVNPPDNAEANRTKVRPGDVLLTITGSRIGRVAPITDRIGEAFVSQHVAIIRLDDTVQPGFVAMFLSHPRGGQEQIARYQYGQTKPGLNLEQIRAFEVPIPPRREQEQYSKASSAYNHLRTQQREALRQAEHLFQTLLHGAFQGEV